MARAITSATFLLLEKRVFVCLCLSSPRLDALAQSKEAISWPKIASFRAESRLFCLSPLQRMSSSTSALALSAPSRTLPAEQGSETVAIALCRAVYDGQAVVAGGKFYAFLFPSTERATAATQLVSELRAGDELARNVSTVKQLLDYCNYECQLMAEGVKEMAQSAPNFHAFAEAVLARLMPGSAAASQRESIAKNFQRSAYDSICQVVRAAGQSVRLCADVSKQINSLASAITGSITAPDRRLTRKICALAADLLTGIEETRNRYLGLQFPSYVVLALFDAAQSGRSLMEVDLAHASHRQTPPTRGIPTAWMVTAIQPVPSAIQPLIEIAKRYLGSASVSQLISARLWAAYAATAPAAATDAAHAAAHAATYAAPSVQPVSGYDEVASSYMVDGGAKVEEEKREMVGGAVQDAAKERKEINDRFGEQLAKLVTELTKAIESIVSNPSATLIDFLSNAANRHLITAFKDTSIPSSAYIPILSGYYRVAEAEARRKRYVGSLARLGDAIERATGGSTPPELDAAARNAFTLCKTTAKAIMTAIEEANAQMEAVFARLAAGQVRELTSGDTEIKTGTETVPAYEAAAWTGDAFTRLSNALEKLRQAASTAQTKANILRGVDELDKYLASGKERCQAAIKTRLDDLSLSYQGILSQVDPQIVPLARKVIEFKLESYRDFYAMLVESDAYLTNAHKAFVSSPAVRDELYRAIAGWTIAAQRSATIDAKFRHEVESIMKALFSSEERAIFSYGDGANANSLIVRGLGRTKPAAAGDVATAQFVSDDDRMYEQFRRSIIQMLTYCPQLHLVFSLINIIEKEFGRGIDTKKHYNAAVRFIVASSIDVCHRQEALTPYDADALRTEKRFHMVGYYPIGNAATEAAGGAAGGAARPPTESTSSRNADQVGVFFRHTFCELRLEDELFVRWMKAISANLLLALDRDRATHGVEKVQLPGAERLLIGGAIDDPVGYVGSTRIIPEAALLYQAFPIACRAYEAYFTWDAKRVGWTESAEPRLIVELPRSSRFYPILDIVRERRSEETMSETYIAKLVAAVNDVWSQFSSTADLAKRTTAILDSFFDEVNNALLIQLSAEHSESEAKKAMDKDRDAIRGVGTAEDEVQTLPSQPVEKRVMRRRVLDALKGISMSVFDIVNQVNTSPETMAADFKSFIDRLQKRLTDVPDNERFRELVAAMQKPDESIGDMQGLFMSFVELVITPLFLLTSVTENFIYRAANLYMQILRCLFAARQQTATGFNVIQQIGGVVTTETRNDARNMRYARHWFTYGQANQPGTGISQVGGTHAERVAYVLDHMEAVNFQQLSEVVSNFTTVNTDHHQLLAAQALWNWLDAFFVSAEATPRAYIHMYQPIYKALMLLIDAGGDRLTFSRKDAGGARVASLDASQFSAFIDDSLTDIKAALTTFMKIGRQETAEAYFRDITSWNPREEVEEVMKYANKALNIVHCDFFMPREYIPTAICYNEICAVNGGVLSYGWVTNFGRNTANRVAITEAAELIAYNESSHLLIGSPNRWSYIASHNQGHIANETHAPYDNNWTSLAPRSGVFAPIIKSGAKLGPGVGRMPWTEADMRVISDGWTASPGHSLPQVGIALNSPALFSPPEQASVQWLGGSDVESLNMGGWIDATMTGGGALNFPATISFGYYHANTQPGLQSVSSREVIMSSLYSDPSHGTRAETLNRLMAKMAIGLTLQGEQPCVLFDLARDLSEHRGLAEYFHPLEMTYPGNQPMTVTFFPDTIGTPVRINDHWHVIYNNGRDWNISLDGRVVAVGAAAATAPHQPSNNYNDGSRVPTHKRDTFLYDVVVIPYFNSIHAKSPRRMSDLTNGEAARYLAIIPQYIAAFRMLLSEVEADIKMGAATATYDTYPISRFEGMDALSTPVPAPAPAPAAAAAAVPTTTTAPTTASTTALPPAPTPATTAAPTPAPTTASTTAAALTPAVTTATASTAAPTPASTTAAALTPAVTTATASTTASTTTTALKPIPAVSGVPASAVSAPSAAVITQSTRLRSIQTLISADNAKRTVFGKLQTVDNAELDIQKALLTGDENAIMVAVSYSVNEYNDFMTEHYKDVADLNRFFSVQSERDKILAVSNLTDCLIKLANHYTDDIRKPTSVVACIIPSMRHLSALICEWKSKTAPNPGYTVSEFQPIVIDWLNRAGFAINLLANKADALSSVVITKLKTDPSFDYKKYDKFRKIFIMIDISIIISLYIFELHLRDLMPDNTNYNSMLIIADAMKGWIIQMPDMFVSAAHRLQSNAATELPALRTVMKNHVNRMHNLIKASTDFTLVGSGKLIMTGGAYSANGQALENHLTRIRTALSTAQNRPHSVYSLEAINALISIVSNADVNQPGSQPSRLLRMRGLSFAEPRYRSVRPLADAALEYIVEDVPFNHAFIHPIIDQPSTEALPSKMRELLIGLIECLARTYRAIREKYGPSIHMEAIKGDFEPYLTAGKFDTAKLTTPLALAAGTGFVDENGPVVMAGLGERGHRHTGDAMALSWALAAEHKELTGSGSAVIPLESVPWTVDLVERLRKLTHAIIEPNTLQAIITRIARLTCIQNNMSLSALACHNPWGCHSVPSCIFHPHSIELDLASVRAGFDLVRGVSTGFASDLIGDHMIGEASLPFLAGYDSYNISLAEPIIHNNVLGGNMNAAAAAAPYLGTWAIPPFPITWGVPRFDEEMALRACYTANPYWVEEGGQAVTLNSGDPTNGAFLTAPAARPAVLQGTAVGAMPSLSATVFHTARANIGFSYIDNGNLAAHHHRNRQAGVAMAVLLHQLRSNTYEKQWLRGTKIIPVIPSFATEAADGRKKYVTEWTANRTKPKALINQQLGFKLSSDTSLDATYTEMVRFSPPRDRWADQLTADERRSAGLFMYLNRNPVSILTSLRLIPFASLYAFSEAFDLYFQLAASRTRKLKGPALVRAHVPSLITEPLSLSRRHRDLTQPNRSAETWLLTDANEWRPGPGVPPGTTQSRATAAYGKREWTMVIDSGNVGESATPTNEGRAYQSITPHPTQTSIPSFYDVTAPAWANQRSFSLCAPSNDAVLANRALVSFPLFAMYVRMLDQYGITLKDELATRLGEIKYDRPESLAQYQNALIHVLGAGQP